jgi:DNA invertase Pin-like site-specific DNA recombinase
MTLKHRFACAGLLPLLPLRIQPAAAKKRGVKFGPKPKRAAHRAREAARMVREEGKSLREVAHHYHVGHSTIVRALERAES